jgi:hypothetical protein
MGPLSHLDLHRPTLGQVVLVEHTYLQLSSLYQPRHLRRSNSNQ